MLLHYPRNVEQGTPPHNIAPGRSLSVFRRASKNPVSDARSCVALSVMSNFLLTICCFNPDFFTRHMTLRIIYIYILLKDIYGHGISYYMFIYIYIYNPLHETNCFSWWQWSENNTLRSLAGLGQWFLYVQNPVDWCAPRNSVTYFPEQV